MRRNDRSDYFNVEYGLASAAITTGSIAITTTESAYHGIEIVAGDTAKAIIIIYDSLGAGGNILERVNVTSADSLLNERYRPVMAKKGIYIVATGVGMSGTIFYGPKG